MWFVDTGRLRLLRDDDAIVARALRVCEARGLTGVAPLPAVLRAVKARHGLRDALWLAWRLAPRPVVDAGMVAMLRRRVARGSDALGVASRVAALYERRVAGDSPSAQEWAGASQWFDAAPPGGPGEREAFLAAQVALGDARSCDQRRLIGLAWRAGQLAAESAASAAAHRVWVRGWLGRPRAGYPAGATGATRARAFKREQSAQLRDLLAALEAD